MLHIAVEMSKLPGVAGGKLLDFIAPTLEGKNRVSKVLKISESDNLMRYQRDSIDSLVNLQRVNDIRGINTFFRLSNERLKVNGTLIGCVEILEQRKRRLFKKFPFGLNACYYFLDFMFKRVFPKFKLTKKLYFFLTAGRNRALSKSEILGRLVYCGFKIEDTEEINNMLYFKARRIQAPLREEEPSTGLILKIDRIGFHGKPITVFKFRTMHPYAQYIQEYVFEQNDLQKGGKFANDFRITKWGRWMRRFWIDEIPMMYNIVRGDLKLVGVRPLSEHYLSLYTPEHKSLRVQGKPGLIPPFYADLPSNLEEIMASESRYIESYGQDPLTTDFMYCMKAFNNIIIHKARSH